MKVKHAKIKDGKVIAIVEITENDVDKELETCDHLMPIGNRDVKVGQSYDLKRDKYE